MPKHTWCLIADLKAKSPGQLPLLSVCLCSPVDWWFSFWEGTLTGNDKDFQTVMAEIQRRNHAEGQKSKGYLALNDVLTCW